MTERDRRSVAQHERLAMFVLGTAVVADTALAVIAAAHLAQAQAAITTAGTITVAAFTAVGAIATARRR